MPKVPRRKQIRGQSHLQQPAPYLQVKGCTKWRKMIAHAPHTWWAGVYYPFGDIDGYMVQCPGDTLDRVTSGCDDDA